MKNNSGNYVFAQKGDKEEEKELVPGSDGSTHEGIKCNTCQHYRHYAEQNPKNSTNTLAIVCTQFKHRLAPT